MKSRGVISCEQDGQGIGPPLPIQRSGNFRSSFNSTSFVNRTPEIHKCNEIKIPDSYGVHRTNLIKSYQMPLQYMFFLILKELYRHPVHRFLFHSLRGFCHCNNHGNLARKKNVKP